MLIDILCSCYASIMLLVSFLCSCIELSFIKRPHQHRIVVFLDSGDKEEVNGEKFLKR